MSGRIKLDFRILLRCIMRGNLGVTGCFFFFFSFHGIRLVRNVIEQIEMIFVCFFFLQFKHDFIET